MNEASSTKNDLRVKTVWNQRRYDRIEFERHSCSQVVFSEVDNRHYLSHLTLTAALFLVSLGPQ